MDKKIIVTVFLWQLCVATLHATTLQDISVYLGQPESEINITLAKFMIDEVMDPSFDRDIYIDKIRKMLADLRRMGDDGYVDPIIIREYMFEPGGWNDFKPYEYDVDNALTKGVPVIDCDLLHKTIDQKKGRCVTMTVLYYTLLYHLGHPVTFGSGPNHLYVIYKTNDDPYDDYSLETSDKGKFFWDRDFDPKRPPKAVESGAYSRRLSIKECVASMVTTLQNYYFKTNQHDRGLAACNLALKYFPLNIESTLNKAYALRRIDAKESDKLKLEQEAVDLTKRAYALGYDPHYGINGEVYKKFVKIKKEERNERKNKDSD